MKKLTRFIMALSILVLSLGFGVSAVFSASIKRPLTLDQCRIVMIWAQELQADIPLAVPADMPDFSVFPRKIYASEDMPGLCALVYGLIDIEASTVEYYTLWVNCAEPEIFGLLHMNPDGVFDEIYMYEGDLPVATTFDVLRSLMQIRFPKEVM